MDSLSQSAQNLVPHTLFFIIFIYLFIGCAGSSLLRGLSLAAARGGYFGCGAWASHCSGFSCLQRMGSGCIGFSSCGAWAKLLHGMWNPPRPGIEPMSPALVCGFFTTGPPGKLLVPHTLVIGPPTFPSL